MHKIINAATIFATFLIAAEYSNRSVEKGAAEATPVVDDNGDP
jgi:hypothetical protein